MSHHARNVVTTAAQKMIPNAFRARSPRVGMIEHPSAAAESTPVGCRNTPDLTCLALSVFGRFNSLIVDFILLFVRFISLFGRVGNYTRMSRNINTLPAWAGSQDHLESGFRSILPSTRETVPAGLLRHRPLQPGQKAERLARA